MHSIRFMQYTASHVHSTKPNPRCLLVKLKSVYSKRLQGSSSGLQITVDPFLTCVSETIDVRSPAEYSKDHIPGAINLPVLDNEERIRVGKLYQESPFEARKTGASLVMSNVSKQLVEHFQSKDDTYCPLVYCWRGGQRSGSFAYLLNQVGFNVFQLEGGYQHYRYLVRGGIEEKAKACKFLILSGKTGTGKTALLHRLKENGFQILDLEGLAKHKGSMLGLWYGEAQPTQKYWETLLYDKLRGMDTSLPIWIESESRSIGRVHIPTPLFEAMRSAPRYEVQLPVSDRVRRTVAHYPHWMHEEKDRFIDILNKLRKYRGAEKVDGWIDLAQKGNMELCVEKLLVEHYDLAYKLSQTKNANVGVEKMVLCGENIDDVWDKLHCLALGRIKSY